MNQEQLINDLRARLTASHDLRSACQIIVERFAEWPVFRRDIADAVSSIFGEENSDVRKDTPNLVDRLIREGFLIANPGGAHLRCAVPFGALLDWQRETPKAILISFRPDIPEAPAPSVAKAVASVEVTDSEDDIDDTELSQEDAVLIGLYTLHLERHHGLFSSATMVVELQRLFREWKFSQSMQSSRQIAHAIQEFVADEILEHMEEGMYRLTERGLQDAAAAKSAWEDRH